MRVRGSNGLRGIMTGHVANSYVAAGAGWLWRTFAGGFTLPQKKQDRKRDGCVPGTVDECVVVFGLEECVDYESYHS